MSQIKAKNKLIAKVLADQKSKPKDAPTPSVESLAKPAHKSTKLSVINAQFIEQILEAEAGKGFIQVDTVYPKSSAPGYKTF